MFSSSSSSNCKAQVDENKAGVDEDQPLDLTVKKAVDESTMSDEKPVELTVARLPKDTSSTTSSHCLENGLKAEKTIDGPDYGAVKENGNSVHPKKRNWIKMEEEDDSFPHEIEEWKKTFASGLCR